VTDNVAVGLTGALIAQGTATFSAGGSITVGSGGLVQNSGVVTNSSVSTLIFGAGSTYEHNFTTTAGTIPNATWNTNSTCEAIGYTTLDNSVALPSLAALARHLETSRGTALANPARLRLLELLTRLTATSRWQAAERV